MLTPSCLQDATGSHVGRFDLISGSQYFPSCDSVGATVMQTSSSLKGPTRAFERSSTQLSHVLFCVVSLSVTWVWHPPAANVGPITFQSCIVTTDTRCKLRTVNFLVFSNELSR